MNQTCTIRTQFRVPGRCDWGWTNPGDISTITVKSNFLVSSSLLNVEKWLMQNGHVFQLLINTQFCQHRIMNSIYRCIFPFWQDTQQTTRSRRRTTFWLAQLQWSKSGEVDDKLVDGDIEASWNMTNHGLPDICNSETYIAHIGVRKPRNTFHSHYIIIQLE